MATPTTNTTPPQREVTTPDEDSLELRQELVLEMLKDSQKMIHGTNNLWDLVMDHTNEVYTDAEFNKKARYLSVCAELTAHLKKVHIELYNLSRKP
ncbi:hypothetical protein HDU89_000705 [Geranomyces variabilis]|nr:hypothetical protein HDU89_000705 [Geranomyces variabilis]